MVSSFLKQGWPAVSLPHEVDLNAEGGNSSLCWKDRELSVWLMLDTLAALILLPVSVETSLINYCLFPTGLGHSFRVFSTAFQVVSANPLKMAHKVKLIPHTSFWLVPSMVPLRMSPSYPTLVDDVI